MKKRTPRNPGALITSDGLVKALRMWATPDLAGIDGEHHINLGRNPKTALGRAFSLHTSVNIICEMNKSDRPMAFTHPIFGKFASLRHYAGWLTATTPIPRMKANWAAKRGKVGLVNYYAAMAEAAGLIIQQNPWIAEELKFNVLPFDSYSDESSPNRTRRDVYMVGILERYTLELLDPERVVEPEMFSLDTSMSIYAGSAAFDHLPQKKPNVAKLRSLIELADAKKPKLDFQNGEQAKAG